MYGVGCGGVDGVGVAALDSGGALVFDGVGEYLGCVVVFG